MALKPKLSKDQQCAKGQANDREGALSQLTSIPPEKYHFSLHKQAQQCLSQDCLLTHSVSSCICVDRDPLSCPPSPSDYLWTSPNRWSTFDVNTICSSYAVTTVHATIEVSVCLYTYNKVLVYMVMYINRPPTRHSCSKFTAQE